MFTLLMFAAVLKVLSAFYLKDGYSTWEAECYSSGISPHPLGCHTFALCHTDGIQLFTCPPQTGYSQTQQACLPLHLISNDCTPQSKLDDKKFIKLIPVAHSTADTVPVCSPQGQILGLLECPSLRVKNVDIFQHRRCTAAAKTCQASAYVKSLIPKEDSLRPEIDISALTSSLSPSLSSEQQNVDISPEEFPPVVCKQKGLHCADESTIADCADVSEEPLFSMSCASLLHDDSGTSVRGYCEEAACVLSTRGLSLQLPVTEFSADNPDVPEQFLKECSQHVGLRCVDNQTLVACAGNLDTTNYAISCMGNSSSLNIGLQGYCNRDTDSCVFLTPEESTSTHPHAENVKNISEATKHHKYSNNMDIGNEHEEQGISLFMLQVLLQDFSSKYSLLSPENLLRGSHTSNVS